MKEYDFESIKQKMLEDKDFKKEYDALETEFTIAKELIGLRIKKNLTQQQLAVMTKTSQSAIARLESGRYKTLTLSFLNRVAEAVGAKVELHLKAE